MSLSLDFSIDHSISPEDLLSLVLQEPQLKLAQIGPLKWREDEEGLPSIVETEVILPSYDVVIVVYAEDERCREIRFDLLGADLRISLSILFGGEADVIEFYQIYASLLNKLGGDALISFNGASPLLLRRDGVITIERDTSYCTDASLRALLPPPIIEGKIPW